MTTSFLHVLFQTPLIQKDLDYWEPSPYVSDYKFQVLLYEPDFDNKQPFSKYIYKKVLWTGNSISEIKLKMTIELGSSDSLLKFQDESQGQNLYIALYSMKGLVKA